MSVDQTSHGGGAPLAQDSDESAAAPRVYHRRKRRPRRSTTLYFAVVLVAGLAGAIVAGMYFVVEAQKRRAGPLSGYLTDLNAFHREYRRFYGRDLQRPEIDQMITRSNDLVGRREYVGATVALEAFAGDLHLPFIFNNLGVLYAVAEDYGRATTVFREALSLDGGYAATISNIRRLNITAGAAEPVTSEQEPNDLETTANLIALERPVEASILDPADIDCFRFSAPPAPRDVVEIEITSISPSFIPGVRIYDPRLRRIVQTSIGKPGVPLLVDVAPQPNATLYAYVFAAKDTSGRYTTGHYMLRVRGRKKYDAYEPNDDIASATPASPGQRIDANIMDENDIDCYAFKSARAGSVAVRLFNLDKGLTPAVEVASSQKAALPTRQENRGGDLRFTFAAREGEVYYVRLSSLHNSSGAYSLVIE